MAASPFPSNNIQTIDNMRRGVGYRLVPPQGSNYIPPASARGSIRSLKSMPTQPQVASKTVFQPKPVPGHSEAPIQPQVPMIHLIKYHLCGSPGWQRIFGNDRATNIQPIQLIQSGQIYAMAFSHAGTGIIPAGSIYLCKNIDPSFHVEGSSNSPGALIGAFDPEKERLLGPYVVGTITLNHKIESAFNFTLYPGEHTSYAFWKVIPHQLTRSDRLSIYAPNLTGASLDLYLTYTSS